MMATKTVFINGDRVYLEPDVHVDNGSRTLELRPNLFIVKVSDLEITRQYCCHRLRLSRNVHNASVLSTEVEADRRVHHSISCSIKQRSYLNSIQVARKTDSEDDFFTLLPVKDNLEIVLEEKVCKESDRKKEIEGFAMCDYLDGELKLLINLQIGSTELQELLRLIESGSVHNLYIKFLVESFNLSHSSGEAPYSLMVMENEFGSTRLLSVDATSTTSTLATLNELNTEREIQTTSDRLGEESDSIISVLSDINRSVNQLAKSSRLVYLILGILVVVIGWTL
ncbi:hypothetical protein [Pseudidiomarina sp. YC-516-91]|uniref:hypothetical protein n=1 Tax=Pseudidiomarina salilacus TaxID=3384452 RepID=UPI0039854010